MRMTSWRLLVMAVIALSSGLLAGCFVNGRCTDDTDCQGNQICVDGECRLECSRDEDCGVGGVCKDGVCTYPLGPPDAGPVGDLDCPPEMSNIDNLYCIDRWQASRSDATEDWAGADNSVAISQTGVFPWTEISLNVAEQACEAAGKRLCSPAEWEKACRGPQERVYAYGNEYLADICNGIDAFCPDPYPHCFQDNRSATPFRIVPTGSFPNCTNDYGVFDMNGNVWEYDGSPRGQGRGGAFNCGDSELLHRCDYFWVIGTSGRNNFGFRCCSDGERNGE